MTFVQSPIGYNERNPGLRLAKILRFMNASTPQQSKKAIGKTLTINMMRSFTNVVSEHLEQLEKDRPVTAMQATAKY